MSPAPDRTKSEQNRLQTIAIDAREFTTSTGRYAYQLIEYLQRIDEGHEYYILLRPHDYDAWQPHNPRFHKVRCTYKEFSFAEQLGFAKQLYSLKADLVHFGMTQQPVLYLRPAVTTVHDLTTLRFYNPSKNRIIFAIKQFVYGHVIRWSARKSKHVLVPTRFVADDLRRYAGIPADKISVTHESSDQIAGSPVALPGLTNKKYIMYIGRPQPHKNLARLIDAFALLRKDDPTLHLVLAGKKDVLFERIESDVHRRGLSNVIFTGFVSEGELRWLYQNCAAYVFPSLSEGFGLPGLEAMRHGAPVISSNATCLPEVYGEAALYFDPTDVDDMAAKIRAVLTDDTLRAKLIAAGSVHADTYSWRRMAEQTLAVYDQSLAQS